MGKASSFFGLKPPAYPNQGFKTPTRPSRPSQDKTPSSSKINLDKTPSLFDSSRDSSPNNTPPGTPKHERRFVKKLSYSPMRDIFKGEENSNSSIGYLMTPPKRKPLGTDYIYMMSSPCRDKENEPFFPCINSLDKLGKGAPYFSQFCFKFQALPISDLSRNCSHNLTPTSQAWTA